MLELKKKSHTTKFWYAIVVFLVLSIAVTAVIVAIKRPLSVKEKEVPTKPIAVSEPKIVSLVSDQLYFGNAFWGRRLHALSQASELGYAYPFSGLSTLGRENYDAWIAGLECPVASGVTPTKYEEETLLKFNCDPAYLPEASKWFDIFMLANNHTDNQGTQGFSSTQTNLDANGIQYFGHYDPEAHSDICEIISMPSKARFDDGSTKSVNLPIALCGYHGVFKIPSAASLAIMQKYSQIMPIIAMAHMGVEYTAAPNSYTIRSYRGMIDNGADVVLGDHPHWVQNSEVYNGHLIVYSMGNFMFDQQGSAELTRSAGIHLRLEMADTKPDSLSKWLEIGEQCKAYHDNCLDNITRANPEKLPFTMSSGIVGTENPDKAVTRAASPSVSGEIIKRLDWGQSIMKLKEPYGGLQ